MRRIHKLTTAREAELIEWFHTSFGNRIAKPVLATRREDGLVELILEYAEGIVPLEKIRSKQYFYDDLAESVKLLAEMHAKGMTSPQLERVLETDTDYFSKRIAALFISGVETHNKVAVEDRVKSALSGNWRAIETRLRNAQLTAYNDFNIRNVQFALTGPVRFDIEYLRLLPAQLDIVNLLEFECEYLSDRQKRELIAKYVKTAERATGKKIEKKKFFTDYEFAAVQRHLELVGYRARDAKGNNVQQLRAQNYHFRKAQSHLETILSGCELSKTEQTAIRNIRNALGRTSIMPEEFSYMQNEAQQSYTIEPASRRGAFKIAMTLLLPAIAAATVWGYTEFENRNIPFANKYLFAGAKIAVVSWEKQPLQRGTIDRYHMYILTGDGRLEWLIGDIDQNSVVWSEDRSKIAFLHYTGPDLSKQWVQFDFNTGEKSSISGKDSEMQGFSPAIKPSDIVELTEGNILELGGLKLYISEGILTMEYAGRKWQQPEITNPDDVYCMIKGGSIYCGMEKNGVANLYTANSDGSNFRRITNNENEATFLFFR